MTYMRMIFTIPSLLRRLFQGSSFSFAVAVWLLVGSSAVAQMVTDTYTSGNGSFTVPRGVTELTIELWGGGGGGGGSSTNNLGGGGGGGGAYLKTTLAVSSGQSIAYTVGAGGNAGAANGGSGANGGGTTFGTYTAGGGTGGSGSGNSSGGGAGGTASGGDINTSGTAGGNGGKRGGDGGAGANGGAGGNGSTNGAGGVGSAPGGGGGGGERSTGWGASNYAGGAGARGEIRVSYAVGFNKRYFSYKSGNWNNATTWTTDPGGTTLVGSAVPGDNDEVVILSGRTVTLSADISSKEMGITINSGGTLEMGTWKMTQRQIWLKGQGLLKQTIYGNNSVSFPNVDINLFCENGGGTVHFHGGLSSNKLPATPLVYNNLILTGVTAGVSNNLSNDIRINGDFEIRSGKLVIGATNNVRLKVFVGGDLTVQSSGSIGVGTANTNTTNNPNNSQLTGGTAPFLNYYASYTHTIELNGNFTNKGTVRFTNQDYPVFNAFPTNGAATVYFRGQSDAKVMCEGQTDFYNIVIDKGSDQTYKTTFYSTDYKNFRLFGRNDMGGNDETDPGNPGLRKALWIRNGSMVLQGQLIIASLSEGGGAGSPNSDFYIPVNGALILDGRDVVVLTTVDDYSEVNAAYGVNGGTGNAYGVNRATQASSLSIYGKLQINDGYLSTRESGGLITWDKASGELQINGGTVDIKQFRAAGGANGLSSYVQTGGTLILRGRFQRNLPSSNDVAALVNAGMNETKLSNGLEESKAAFNINNATNVFNMSGGTIKIYDGLNQNNSNGLAVDIFSSPQNISVTGGTFEFLPTSNSHAYMDIRSNAPLGNIVVNRSSGSTVVRLSNAASPSGHLKVLGHVDLQSGTLNAQGYNLNVGGDMNIASTATYTTGTNRTIFDGDKKQTLKVDNSSHTFNKLIVAKPAGQELVLAGSQTTFAVNDSLSIELATLNDAGKIIAVKGNIFNSGKHIGAGRIELNGTNKQTLGGNDKGVFQNLYLNNNNSNLVSFENSFVINGTLTFSRDRALNIGSNNLRFTESASIAGNNGIRYIQTAGQSGDGGLTFEYDGNGSKLFPLGVSAYTPASIGFSSAPTTYGSITVVPVNNEHPATTAANSALKYYWRVKSQGFSDHEGKVTHHFNYLQASVQGTETNYRPAHYNGNNFTWTQGTGSGINTNDNIISDWNGSEDLLDGDYTAGLSGAFGTPKKYYSRTSGNWNSNATWSTVSHSGAMASAYPTTNDIVIIGNGHTVTLSGTANSAFLQIEEGGVLDVGTYGSSNFGVVLSHHSGKNGKIRIGKNDGNGYFVFPTGDFVEFHKNLGTIEYYRTGSNERSYFLPKGVKEYGHLILSPSNGTIYFLMPNHDVLINGDMTINGSSGNTSVSPTNSGNYPSNETRVSKNITVYGNLLVNGGLLNWLANGGTAQNIIVYKDVVIASGARIDAGTDATNQQLAIGGSLQNDGSAELTRVPLYFFGNSDGKITGSGGTGTNLGKLTLDKGNSQATKLTLDVAGTLSTLTNDWLTLKNGTFEYKRTNPSSDFTVSTTTPMVIAPTAGFLVDYVSTNQNVLIANAGNNNADLMLNGKLTVVNGNVFVGPTNAPNNHNDIEYSGGGSSEIELRGGSLVVNGQIRRNPSTSVGVLKYSQSGGELTVNGRNHQKGNAKLEILNAGSRFNMSGGEIRILRGGGTTFGDLYIRPETSNVTGGSIVFSNGLAEKHDYTLDSNVPLYNLIIKGATGSNSAGVKLMVSPLVLKGSLTIENGNSSFDANNVDITIKGDFNNSGSYVYGNNTTLFNGNEQKITGSSNIAFYNWDVSPVVSLTLNKGVLVENNLSIGNGTLVVANNSVEVKGQLLNNSNYTTGASGKVVLNHAGTQQLVSGTGTFGRLEINNIRGAQAQSDISMTGELLLTKGIFNIGKNLLSLGVNSTIGGFPFSANKMITTNGVYSSRGIKKVFGVGAITFTYPLGVGSKYTPVNILSGGSHGQSELRVNNVNSHHPAVLDANNVLQYFWELEGIGFDGSSANLTFDYLESDVKGNINDYLGARLLTPGTDWQKLSGAVDQGFKKLRFNFTGSPNGEYTAGKDDAIPANVPVFTSKANGTWQSAGTWTQTSGTPIPFPSGGPNGFIVIIDHEVTINQDDKQSYRTAINNKLRITGSTFGHNLGLVSGEGTLYLENGQLPEGKFDNFLSCGSNATLEFGGSGDYTILADLISTVPNLVLSGSGTRTLPDKDLTVCRKLLINGPTLDNSVHNRKLFLKGEFIRQAGTFLSGTGANAWVVFEGSSKQSIGGFSGTSLLNNMEVKNAAGLDLTGAVEINGQLKLSNGIITTSATNTLTVLNTDVNAVSAASANSYIDGPLTKKMYQSASFLFPLGTQGRLGNKLLVSSVQSGTQLWTAQYQRPNGTADQFDEFDGNGIPLLTAVNHEEYWSLKSESGGQAIIQTGWDANSGLNPDMTVNGVSDMKLAQYSASKWTEVVSTASGTNNSGIVKSNSLVSIPIAGCDFTTATKNAHKPTARFKLTDDVCGDAGIPIELSSKHSVIAGSYRLKYSVDGVVQPEVSFNTGDLPYSLPTSLQGLYRLVSFTYANGGAIGAVGTAEVQVWSEPIMANAGVDQALKGVTSATLGANNPSIGVGLWTVVSGAGGSFVNANQYNTVFNGNAGTSYTLRWTITNGTCISADEVKIDFQFAYGLWTGTVSSDWNNTANWYGGLKPVDGDDVQIQQGTFNPEIAGSVTINKLTVNSGALTVKPGSKVSVEGDIEVKASANLVLSNDLGTVPASFIHKGSVSGDVSVNVTYTTLPRNWYLGHPVTTNSKAYFDQGITAGLWKYAHNTTSEEWTVIGNNQAITNPMEGYIVNNSSKAVKTVTHKGALAEGSKNYVFNLMMDAKARWNLVANPYNSYINLKALDFTNIEWTIWYRTVDASNYYQFVTYNRGEDIVLPFTESKLLAPMQAFWVRVGQPGTFTFSQAARVHPTGVNPNLKSAAMPVDDVLYLELHNGKTSDQAAIAFRESGSTVYSGVDSEKRLSAGAVPNLYTVKSGRNTAINIQPSEPDDAGIPLGMTLDVAAAGDMTVKALNVSQMRSDLDLWLEDKATGERINLRSQPEYSFKAAAGSSNVRFVLFAHRVATDIESHPVDQAGTIKIFGHKGNAVVVVDDKLLIRGTATAVIYNLAGQQLSATILSENRSEIALPQLQGIYVVEVKAGGVVAREKVMK